MWETLQKKQEFLCFGLDSFPRGAVFGCRDYYDLTYQSCQESHKYDKVFGHIAGADIGSLSVTQALRLGGL
jgi:hypothetical protein